MAQSPKGGLLWVRHFSPLKPLYIYIYTYSNLSTWRLLCHHCPTCSAAGPTHGPMFFADHLDQKLSSLGAVVMAFPFDPPWRSSSTVASDQKDRKTHPLRPKCTQSFATPEEDTFPPPPISGQQQPNTEGSLANSLSSGPQTNHQKQCSEGHWAKPLLPNSG